jgi:cytoskeletal protein CcmA (bactofilin family)
MSNSFSGVGNAQNGRVDGVTGISGGIYDDLKINGICTASGPLTAKRFEVDGVFTCKGDLTVDSFDCDGVVNIEGNLRAASCDIDGVVNIGGNKVEASEIVCDGVLSIKGQISADTVRADGFVNATEIVGDSITIGSNRRSFFFRMLVKLREVTGMPEFSVVDLIEATTVRLRGVKAKEVNGHDVEIGENCEIERVTASGSLHISPWAKVEQPSCDQ